MEFFDRIYLDKEKDIIVNLYKENDDELTYIIETPNHKTGNLITNLARICNVETEKDENDMKIIKGTIPAEINADNDEVYCFRLGGIKIANIYADGHVFIKAKIPAINKTLMSQTKEYKIPVEKTIIKTYIKKKEKFRTDLHTHIFANLNSDDIIALGIKHQIKYLSDFEFGKIRKKKERDEEWQKKIESNNLTIMKDIKKRVYENEKNKEHIENMDKDINIEDLMD